MLGRFSCAFDFTRPPDSVDGTHPKSMGEFFLAQLEMKGGTSGERQGAVNARKEPIMSARLTPGSLPDPSPESPLTRHSSSLPVHPARPEPVAELALKNQVASADTPDRFTRRKCQPNG